MVLGVCVCVCVPCSAFRILKSQTQHQPHSSCHPFFTGNLGQEDWGWHRPCFPALHFAEVKRFLPLILPFLPCIGGLVGGVVAVTQYRDKSQR